MLLILGAFTDAPNNDAPVINIPHAAPMIEKPNDIAIPIYAHE